MPLIPLLFLVGGTGFAGGFFTGQSLTDLLKPFLIVALMAWLFVKAGGSELWA